MGGVWQFIIFNEYLPTVLGPDTMRRYGLNLEKQGFWNGYDEAVNADVTNSFSTAAFRFGHSQIGDFIRFANQLFNKQNEVEFSSILRRPREIYELHHPGGSGVDSVLLGMISQQAEEVDNNFSKEMTAHLFAEKPPHGKGMDLATINLQRGRDHGLPGYNAYREWCGLPKARNFDDLVDIPDRDIRYRFSRAYDDVDDIDLWAAGVCEKHLPGAMVGPTFACIIGRQFRKSKAGDRFWHERDDPITGFTPAQLAEIRKASLARMICDNSDQIDKIQKFVMLQPISEVFKNMGRQDYREAYTLATHYRGDNNERVKCEHIPDIDYSKWTEYAQRGRG